MQDGHEDGTFHRELVLPASEQLFQDILDLAIAPQSFEHQGWPDLDRFDRWEGSAFVGIHHRDVLREPATRRQDRVDVSFFL